MISEAALTHFQKIETPFFYYDMDLLRLTVGELSSALHKHKIIGHYALKANANEPVVKTILNGGIGAECATGNEVDLAIRYGFKPEDTVYAGVAKTDKEILTALRHNIFCFNCESIQELQVINGIAASMGLKAHVAIRVNPDIDAHTHKYISTGLEENKFGISPWAFDSLFDTLRKSENLVFEGLHFHIGSQITQLGIFKSLCARIMEIEKIFEDNGFYAANIDLGGGLGVDYESPIKNSVPAFEELCSIIDANLERRPGQRVHIEPGRSVVAQCCHLISRIVYVKEGRSKKFAILDAGMNNLIRPALYQAHHEIENLSSKDPMDTYNVVGCVCESSDTFAEGFIGPKPHRGDIMAIHSAGAYGQVMNMRYNQRDLAPAVYSDEIK